MIRFATVTQASPLLVLLDGAATATAAKILTRGDTFAPALNTRVLVTEVAGRLYVLGAA